MNHENPYLVLAFLLGMKITKSRASPLSHSVTRLPELSPGLAVGVAAEHQIVRPCHHAVQLESARDRIINTYTRKTQTNKHDSKRVVLSVSRKAVRAERAIDDGVFCSIR